MWWYVVLLSLIALISFFYYKVKLQPKRFQSSRDIVRFNNDLIASEAVCSNLPKSIREEIWDLFETTFVNEHPSFESFDEYLCNPEDKRQILIFRDTSKESKIQGFILMKIIDRVINDQPIVVIIGEFFALNAEFRRTSTPLFTLLKFCIKIKISKPFIPLYYFFITYSFKSYLSFSRSMGEYYPCHSNKTPTWAQDILDSLGREIAGDWGDYDSRTCVIRDKHKGTKGRLSDLARSMPRDLSRTFVWFSNQNPQYQNGDCLCVICCVGLRNVYMAAKNAMWKAMGWNKASTLSIKSNSTSSSSQQASTSTTSTTTTLNRYNSRDPRETFRSFKQQTQQGTSMEGFGLAKSKIEAAAEEQDARRSPRAISTSSASSSGTSSLSNSASDMPIHNTTTSSLSLSALSSSSSSSSTASSSTTSFQLDENIVSDSIIADLKTRLDRTRLPLPVGSSISKSHGDENEEDGEEDELASKNEYGVSLRYMSDLLDFWKTKFDCEVAVRSINELPQYQLDFDGICVHFVHVRSSSTSSSTTPCNVIPLIMIHGWTSTFWEFHRMIELLTKSDDDDTSSPTFDLIIPSIPGYTHDQEESSTEDDFNPLDAKEIAKIYIRLMTTLSYSRYVAHGSEWGHLIATYMAQMDSQRCLGLHLSDVCVWPPQEIAMRIRMYIYDYYYRFTESYYKKKKNFNLPFYSSSTSSNDFHFNLNFDESDENQSFETTREKQETREEAENEDEENDGEENYSEWAKRDEICRNREQGFEAVESSCPQTLSFGLADSPIGLAAWLANHFRVENVFEQTDKQRGRPKEGDDHLDGRYEFTFEDLLMHVVIHWLSNSTASVCGLYYDTKRNGRLGPAPGKTWVPTAVCTFTGTMCVPPKKMVDLFYNVKRWRKYDEGVRHCPAMEAPQILAKDIREFFLDDLDVTANL